MTPEVQAIIIGIGTILGTMVGTIVNSIRTSRVEKTATAARRTSDTVRRDVDNNLTKLHSLEAKTVRAQDGVSILERVMMEKFNSLETEVREQRNKIEVLNSALTLAKHERDEEHKRADALATSLKELKEKIAAMSQREGVLTLERDTAVVRATQVETELKEALSKMNEMDGRIIRLEAERDEARRINAAARISPAQPAAAAERTKPATGNLRPVVDAPTTSELGHIVTGIISTQATVMSQPSSISEVLRVLPAGTFVAFRPKPVIDDDHRWIAIVDPIMGWMARAVSEIQQTGTIAPTAPAAAAAEGEAE